MKIINDRFTRFCAYVSLNLFVVLILLLVGDVIEANNWEILP